MKKITEEMIEAIIWRFSVNVNHTLNSKQAVEYIKTNPILTSGIIKEYRLWKKHI